MESSHRSRASLVLATLCLWAALFLFYSGVGEHDFVGYDDGVYVSENQEVLSGVSLKGVRWAFSSGYAGNWHPLTWISHMLDVEFFGVDPGAMAGMNVLLHGMTSALFLAFLVRTTGALWPSLLATLLFALHPLRVESVAWIAERKDVLSGFFFMATLHLWTRYVDSPSRRRYASVLFAFACGLMSKPAVVTLPFVLLLLDIWPLKRLSIGSGKEGGPLRAPGSDSGGRIERPGVGRLLAEKAPLFAMALVASVVTYRVQASGGALRLESLSPLSARLANAATSYTGYLLKMVWPVDLACFYPLPPTLATDSPWTAAVFFSVLGLCVISGGVWFFRGQRPGMLVGWCWYLGTLIPMIGLVQVGNQSMADRYTYLPSMGMSLIVVGVLGTVEPGRAKRISILLGIVALVGFASLTPVQVAVWRDGETLFRHALSVTDANYLAHYNLGTGLLRQEPSRLAEARPHLEAAVRIQPRHAGAQLNLGAADWLEGQVPAAVIRFENAVRLNPGDPEAHLSLGSARFETGQISESIRHFEQAIALAPRHHGAWMNLATVLLSEQRLPEARSAFEQALALVPGDPQARAGLEAASSAEAP